MTDVGDHQWSCLPLPWPLVLAAASPRRLELLARVRLRPEVMPAHVDESVRDGETPEIYVERLAREKATAIAARRPAALVLAADTAVVLDGTILGKPLDRNDAFAMLTRLSGRTHQVLTGVAAVAGGEVFAALEVAQVTFGVRTRIDLEWYLGTGEPFDKAGGYGLQGAGGVFVERIEGDPTTVIGLPLRTTIRLLSAAGLSWPGAASLPGD